MPLHLGTHCHPQDPKLTEKMSPTLPTPMWPLAPWPAQVQLGPAASPLLPKTGRWRKQPQGHSASSLAPQEAMCCHLPWGEDFVFHRRPLKQHPTLNYRVFYFTQYLRTQEKGSDQ